MWLHYIIILHPWILLLQFWINLDQCFSFFPCNIHQIHFLIRTCSPQKTCSKQPRPSDGETVPLDSRGVRMVRWCNVWSLDTTTILGHSRFGMRTYNIIYMNSIYIYIQFLYTYNFYIYIHIYIHMYICIINNNLVHIESYKGSHYIDLYRGILLVSFYMLYLYKLFFSSPLQMLPVLGRVRTSCSHIYIYVYIYICICSPKEIKRSVRGWKVALGAVCHLSVCRTGWVPQGKRWKKWKGPL